MTSHSLRLERLVKRYGHHLAIDDVSIHIERGRFVTLLGPSGSGKTTILMSIAGFVEPSSGRILLDNDDITRLPPEKRNFGMVFQGYALFPTMSVEENVWFPLRVRGIGRQEARAAIKASLDLVRLGSFASRLPGELSGGQQQRVALARALVFEPNLLLLDEPLSALDRQLRAELQWELRSLHRRLGTTFINVTHDQEEALSMSDEIVILREGRIEQVGSPAELYGKPATRFVASFLGESNFISGHISAKEKDVVHVSVGRGTFVQATGCRGAGATGDAILLALRPEEIEVFPERPTLTNTVRGDVVDVKYLGASRHIQVSTEDLGLLTVTTSTSRVNSEVLPGAHVWLGWSPDSAVGVREGR